MDPKRLKTMLRQTLDDFRLSRGERQALTRILEHVQLSEQSLSLYRQVAFELAREVANEANRDDLLSWLEDVCRVLQTAATDSEAPRAEALFSPEDPCQERLVGLLKSARSSVDICVFTITDDRISDAVAAAHSRGVATRVITDDEKAFDRGSDVDRLRTAGVSIRVDCTPYHMHHKFAVFDRRLLVTGSYNWTRSADKFNEENYVISGDQRLVHRYSEVFEQLWEKFG